jgi:putative transposase
MFASVIIRQFFHLVRDFIFRLWLCIQRVQHWLLSLFKRSTFEPIAGARQTAALVVEPMPPKLAFGKHRAKPEWVTQWVIQAKAYNPKKGCRTIANDFNLAYAYKRFSISKSFVHKALLEHAYAVGDLRLKWRSRLPFPCVRNAVWAMDLTGKQVLPDTKSEALKSSTCSKHASKPKSLSKHAINSCDIVGIIDHGSRLLLTLKPIESKHGWRLALCLIAAMLRFGKPKAVRTDNDRVFTGLVFRSLLLVSGIKHQRTALASPWQNGRIERLFGTLKRELDLRTVTTARELNHLMVAFATFYNEVRPHQNLAGLTPAMTWAGVTWTDLRQTQPKSVEPYSSWDGALMGYRLRL